MRKLILPLILVAFAACDGCKPAADVSHSIIDCTRADSAQLASLLNEFRTLLTGDAPDWAAIEAKAEGAGATIGGCALSTLVQEYLGNRGAPPPTAAGNAASTQLETFRAKMAGGATFHTDRGDL